MHVPPCQAIILIFISRYIVHSELDFCFMMWAKAFIVCFLISGYVILILFVENIPFLVEFSWLLVDHKCDLLLDCPVDLCAWILKILYHYGIFTLQYVLKSGYVNSWALLFKYHFGQDWTGEHVLLSRWSACFSSRRVEFRFQASHRKKPSKAMCLSLWQ